MDPEAQVPRTLGKYELLRLLARGGMGEVHLARLTGELGFEKRLVVKTVRPELATEPRFVELFAMEAKTVVGLSHPNITPIYELGRAEDGTLYAAMGWVDGPSLARLLERLRSLGRRLDAGAALFIVREILDGLAHAHSPGRDRPPIVHRDISPRNLLIDRSGRVQIVDFGIAKPAEAHSRGAAGSIGYMAPEQARGGAVDPRADVFGVGSVLYELLTSERAFAEEGVWMSPALDQVPSAIQPLLERALALEPDRRFADADEFLRALAPVLAELAPSFASRDLARLLAELFPADDWDVPSDDQDHAGPRTPATQLTVETYATRLQPITQPDPITGAMAVLSPEFEPESALEPAPEPELVPEPVPVPARLRMRDDRRVYLVALAAAIVAGTLGYTLATSPSHQRPNPRSHERVELEQPEATSPTPSAPEQTHDAPLPSPTIITLDVSPADAIVVLDGLLLAGPPYAIELGEHPRELVVSREGHHEQRSTLDPAAPPQNPLTIALEPLATGTLEVVAPGVAWAQVWLDGVQIGTTPLAARPVVEGRHKLEVRCTAEVCETPRTLLERVVQIRPGQRQTVNTDD